MKPKKLDKYFLLNWRKAWMIVVGWFLAIILHNVVYAIFKRWFDATGTDEPIFFIIAIIIIPLYVIMTISYSLVRKFEK